MQSHMTLVFIAVTIALGCTQSLQVALLGFMGRLRGPAESTFVSILGTLAALSLALAIQASADKVVMLPAAFTSPWFTGGIALVAGGILAMATHGIPALLGLTGFIAAPYLFAAASISSRLGVGLFLACVITGQLLAAVTLDHFGAFGTTPRPIDALRILGVLALLVGVVLIKGRR